MGGGAHSLSFEGARGANSGRMDRHSGTLGIVRIIPLRLLPGGGGATFARGGVGGGNQFGQRDRHSGNHSTG